MRNRAFNVRGAIVGFGIRVFVCGALLLTARVELATFGSAALPDGNVDKRTERQPRPPAKRYLSMPDREDGPLPPLLSQTGAFQNTRELRPSPALIAYEINVSFWSDGATKSRWVSLPNEGSSPGSADSKIAFNPTGEWSFPAGTVFVKHFELSLDEQHPDLRRRLETRLLVRDATAGVYGVTYRWRPDGSDAELLSTNRVETLLVKTQSGIRTQTWYYPSRQDCRVCHTDKAGGVLGVKTRQLNRDLPGPHGTAENQLQRWNRLGLFDSAFAESELPHYARLSRADDPAPTLEDRARSYLDANCAHCHRPGGTVAYFDARYDTPLPQQSLVDGPVLIDQGLDKARVIAPNDPWRSVALLRVNTLEAMKMPPLAHETLDPDGVALLRAWIESLPGPRVLPPPTISPPAGKYAGPLEVTLAHLEPGVTIRYTLDGSVPAAGDPVYQQPIKLGEATTIRAKAFKAGYTRSITVQATFILGDKGIGTW